MNRAGVKVTMYCSSGGEISCRDVSKGARFGEEDGINDFG